MTENLSHNRQELFEEVKERARAEGAFSKEAWDEMVDDVIEDHRRVGEMHDDEDLVRLAEELKERFSDAGTEAE